MFEPDLSHRDLEDDGASNAGAAWRLIAQNGAYQAYAKELEFMWRWIIACDGHVVQEGCSISLESSVHSVRHVLAFYVIASRPPVLGAHPI
ncbi:MAG: soluble methane monooxygenase-binding protein MmoD [Methylococcaceae bacterium]|nr:soluble methane monooxygenase-binding protein MmoD [Methylococcaceae bacterium]